MTEPLCMCKDRPFADCPGQWEPGCDLGNNPARVRVAQPGIHGDYAKLLADTFAAECDYTECAPDSRLEFIGESIFDFTTYEGHMSERFAEQALKVCEAISNGKTFEYIKDPDQYQWYLLMVNMPFFAGKLEWGTSIRGAWWDHKIVYRPAGGFFVTNNGEFDQINEPVTFTQKQWKQFIAAVIEFGKGDETK